MTLYDRLKDVSYIQGRLTDVALNRSDNYTFASFQCMLVCKNDDENAKKIRNNKEERNQPPNFINRLGNHRPLTDVAFNRSGSDNYTFASFECLLVCKTIMCIDVLYTHS